MTTDHPHVLRQVLVRRVRLAAIAAFIISTLLPAYVPQASLEGPGDEELSQRQYLLVEDGFLMKTSALTNSGARRAYTKGIVHVVAAGESLESIAKRYAISVQTIRWANDLQQNKAVSPGQELIILPVDGVLHEVKRGQSLVAIAEQYDKKVEEIRNANGLKSDILLAGQQLIIPGGTPLVEKPTQVAQTPDKPTNVVKPTSPDKADNKKPISVDMGRAEGGDVTSGVLQKPCSDACHITQYYHPGHYALDMQEKGGGNVYAAEAGTVIRAEYGWNGGYGNVIEIDHGNGLVTLYGHNKELYVEEGDVVTRGQHISAMGNTGLVYGKTGIHVHFEVRLKGTKKNPLLYLQ